MFDINNFNVIQDENYYYVFRSLEAGDMSDIENGITDLMRTDRERYTNTPKYSEDSTISLEEMFDHIKIHYRKDTNCISFTTNAGVAIMYGRDKELFNNEAFNDKYVMLKIPKNELGTTSHFAPDYMISEIEKVVAEYYEHLDELDKYQFDRISNCIIQEQLDSITKSLEGEEIFEGGIEFGNTNSTSYTTLSSRQNLEKNKLIAKIDLIPFDIVPNISNKFLIKTIGSAFASMEVTHYKSIDNKYLIDCPNNIIDIFSILQQSNNPKVSEIENIIIDKLSKGELGNLEEFKYYNYKLTEDDLSIDSLYTMSDNGKVDYNIMRNLYIKSFYLAKSKLRVQHSINLLKQVLGNSYDDVLNELSSTYGIEPEITNKQSKEKIVISDSIGLDYSTELEKKLLNILTDNYSNQLEYLIDNKEDCVAIAMLDLLDEHKSTSKEDYYANAVIDTFDWKQFNINSIALRHRNNLISKLKESNFMSVYDELKNEYSAKDLSRILLANIINGNNEIDKELTFTIEQLEDYLGYYKVKDKDIKLTRYQADAIRNMKKSYKYHRYTNVILPTGTGKSYVAITEMLEYLNTGRKVLYLAPDVEILNQIRYYLVSEVIGDSFNGDLDKIVKEKYPNLVLQTYSYLATGTNSQDIINDKYDFIVTDELHRTGAPEWKSQIEALYNNQDENCKMLGITATPTRDCDGVDMAEYWARFFGYTNEEIYANHHLAYNMDYNQAIVLGYLANPRVINCEYEFLRDFEAQVQYIKNEEEREKILARLRKDLSKAKGVPEILRENVLPGDACLVFCPMINVDEETGKRITGEQVIEKYQRKLEEIYGKDTINCYSMLGTYGDKKNQQQLENFQNVQSDKINFMIVIGKMDEGKHGNYNKLIWFRTLGDNSFVLCSQQLGRISRLLKPGEQIREDERPLAIDLPNNLLRIQGTKEIKKSVDSDDISKFRLVINWIKEYNKIPDINSKDYVESSMASVLKIIIFKYHNKVKDIESINNYKKKIQTLEIKRLSEEIEINIWDLNLPKRNIETKKRRQVPYYLQANALYRDYLGLLNEKILPWEESYKLAKIYYEEKGNLLVPPKYKTKEKYNLGTWIINQRMKYKNKKLTQEQIKQLETIGMVWNPFGKKWNMGFEYAKAYYELNGNIHVPEGFLTEDGYNLGNWVKTQRRNYKKNELLPEQIEKLESIEMIWKAGKSKSEQLTWDEWYELARAYYEEKGDLHVPSKYTTKDGYGLGKWIITQREKYKCDKLTQEQMEQLESIGMKWRTIKERLTWEESYKIAQQYYEEKGDLHVPFKYTTKDGYNLGIWITAQRQAYAKSNLAQEQIEQLESIGMIWKVGKTTKSSLDWKEWYKIAQQYYEEKGDLLVPLAYTTEDGSKLGQWIITQRKKYKHSKLTQEQMEQLESIGMKWKVGKTKIEQLKWEEAYELAKVYYDEKGDLLVPQGYISEDGFKLGTWITTQRQAYKKSNLAQEQIELLESIGMKWKVGKTKEEQLSWNDWYELAKVYYEEKGNLLVPVKYATKDGYNLGIWINTQRIYHKKEKLTQEQIEQLESIGMVWRTIKERLTWEEWYEIAQQYYEEKGNLLVPPKYKTEEKCNLGYWIITQRIKYKNNELTQEQIKQLELIGMIWKAGKNKSELLTWEEAYELAKLYYEEKGNLLVPGKYTTKDGYTLGIWITAQRQAYGKSNLAQEQIEQLESIGMKWKVGKTKEEQLSWDDCYELAKLYYEEKGNLLVPVKYATKDGYNLGTWINTQRNYYKKEKLTEEKIKKLESIGMVWNARDNKIKINYVNTSGIQSLNKNLEDDNVKKKK